MTEQAFLTLCERILDRIEDAIDAAGVDAEFVRNGHVLEIEFADGSKIVVNGQAPLREIWLAARDGAYHFRENDGKWVDTRGGQGFSAMLSACVSRQSGETVQLAVG